MAVLEVQAPLVVDADCASATLNHAFTLQIDVLESWLCRVALVPDSGFRVPATWMIAPHGDVPWEGRPRLDRSGFSGAALSLQNEAGSPGQSLVSENFRIAVQHKPLALTIESRAQATDDWQTLLTDRPMAAYRYLAGRDQLHHAQTLSQTDVHLGLGDKTGPLDRSGRRFRCLQTDALGYNAETSDPLYKHIPWIITGNTKQGYCGIFYDTFSELTFDLGAEHSNYHDHYRTVEVYENALVYYVVTGPKLRDIVPRFQKLVGFPHLQPRWASGFAFTSMHHADADNAQEVMQNFIAECAERQLPISALHSGSGLTTRDDGRRYVFTWNKNKFPDRDGFFKTLGKAQLHSCANIKPVLLREHPLFDEVAEFGGFIVDGEGAPAIEMFWGGPGASLDFTNPKTVKWWQHCVQTQVLGAGFSSTWNDNNECEMWDEQASLHGFGDSLKAMDARPVQALLMNRASFEATLEMMPDKRPYAISRAGPAGIARYAQTWSGDNKTSWHTLRWNLANGLSMSLSGMPLHGHDIGGFDGPRPDAELLCRWVEMMALHPRAVMNSWKPAEENPATLPWMHEQVADQIRRVLELRYQFLPWLYHLGFSAHTQGVPVVAPMMYYFDDDHCRLEQTQYMLGESVLVAPVVECGAITRDVYLPVVSGGWYHWAPAVKDSIGNNDTAVFYKGGQSVTIDAPPGGLPVFVRSGAVLPIATCWQVPHNATEVTIVVFVDQLSGTAAQQLFFDDGESWKFKDKLATLLSVDVSWSPGTVNVLATHLWSADDCPQLKWQVVGQEGCDINVEFSA